MLTQTEKYILETLIHFYKTHGGTLSHEMHDMFRQSAEFKRRIKHRFYNLNPVIEKAIALGLLKYTLPDRTGLTSLTKAGWTFTNFEEFEKLETGQREIDKLTIEKLEVDLVNSKRQAKMFIPLTILSISLGIISILTFFLSFSKNATLNELQSKQEKLESIIDKLEIPDKELTMDTTKK